jgi:hypothetical protein
MPLYSIDQPFQRAVWAHPEQRRAISVFDIRLRLEDWPEIAIEIEG